MSSPMKTSPSKRVAGSPLKSPKKSKGDENQVEVLKERTDPSNVEAGVKPAAVVEDKLLFVKVTENAFAPTKGSKLAAGFDLKSAYDYTVPKRGSLLIQTDLKIQLPRGTYGRIAPRSGLALKNKIDVGAGVVDEDYRGNLGVILFNHGDEDFVVKKGDRIAQLICERICYPEAEEAKELQDSARGEAGFGSTGVSA